MPTASRKRMKISQKGLEMIGRFEGFRGRPYNDPAGHATVGFGHLLHHGPVNGRDLAIHHQEYGLDMTRKEGLELLRKDVARYEAAVNNMVKVPLAQPQFDALVSFAYNVGTGALASSTLLKLLNQERRTAAANEFLKWDRAGLRKMPGLTKRRQAERALFLSGIDRTKPAPAKPKKRPAVPFAKGPSAHYSWLEVHRGRKPFGVRERANAIRHARKLEQLRAAVNKERARHGLKPTALNVLSWYRPEWYNTKIGGARKSQHIKALATDISLQEIDRTMPWEGGRRDFDNIASKIFIRDGFGQYPGGSRHVDSRGYRARWSSWSR